MQIVAVIAVSEKDFVKSLLNRETEPAKKGGILINDFLYKFINHSDQLQGQTLQGVIITKEASEYYQLRSLISDVFQHIRF